MAASAAPPRTVKSSPWTATRRPSIRPWPTTTLAGRKASSSPEGSYVPTPAIAPVSWKDFRSSSRSIRSRTVSRPLARCRSTRSAPPSSRASASRRRSSSISGSQPIARCYFAHRVGAGRIAGVDSVGAGAYVLRIDLVPRAWQLRAPVLPAVRRGLLAGIPVGVAMLVDLELDAPASGAISTGALLAGFVAFDAPARTRLVWQLLCAPVIGAAGALGVLTGEPGALAALTMGLFASIAGMSVAVSRRLAIAALNCVLALLLGQGLSVSPSGAPAALLLGGAGAALQALVSAAAWTRDRAVEPIDFAEGVGRARRAIAANLSLESKSLRHALRWGTALGLAVGVYHVVDLGLHGYWVPLTVLFVLRPEPDETVERIAMRAAGTLAGLAVATPLAMLIGGLDVVEA